MRWLWLLVVACQPAGAPRPSPPPRADTAAARAAAPAAPTPPARQAEDALAAYDAVLAIDRARWRADHAGRPLWLRAAGRCERLEPVDERWSGALEICRIERPSGTTSCRRPIQLTDDGLDIGAVSFCNETAPDGSGRGSGGSSGFGITLLRPLSEDEHTTVFALLHLAQVDVTTSIVEQPCQGDPRARRRCPHVSNPRVSIVPDQPRTGAGGIGIDEITLDRPADCTIPCPEQERWGELRGLHDRLSRYRFVARADPMRFHVHHSLEACTADPAPGPIAQSDRACEAF